MMRKEIKKVLTLLLAVSIGFGLGNYSNDIKASGTLQSQGKLVYENQETGEEVVIDTSDHQILQDDIDVNTNEITNIENNLSIMFTVLQFEAAAQTIQPGGYASFSLKLNREATGSSIITDQNIMDYYPIAINRISTTGSTNAHVIGYYYDINDNTYKVRVVNMGPNAADIYPYIYATFVHKDFISNV